MLHVTSRIYTQTKPGFPISNQTFSASITSTALFSTKLHFAILYPFFLCQPPSNLKIKHYLPSFLLKLNFKNSTFINLTTFSKSKFTFSISKATFSISNATFLFQTPLFSISNSFFFLYQTPLYFFYNQIKWVNFRFLILLVYM